MSLMLLAVAWSTALSASASAALTQGTYGFTPDLHAWWSEIGPEGNPGNRLLAGSLNHWGMDHAILQPGIVPAPVGSGYNWSTVYAGGILTLRADGPWITGSDDVVIPLGDLLVLSSGTSGRTSQTISWKASGQGTDPVSGHLVLLEADYQGDYSIDPVGKQGNANLGEFNAKITVVPAPGAFLLVSLGTCAVSWIRRRRTL